MLLPITTQAAYIYYYVPQKVELAKLIKAALIFAKKSGHDVVNCLNIMDSPRIFEVRLDLRL